MCRILNILALGLAATLPAAAQAPAAKPEAKPAPVVAMTPGKAMEGTFGFVEMQFVPAADAMPEEKWGFAPKDGEFKGVKTFAQQVRHIAAANHFFASLILGEKSDIDMSNIEMGPENLKTKAEIMAYLKASFARAHQAFGALTPAHALSELKNPFGPGTVTPLGLASLMAFHDMDHYGQMVVYLRMNGIVPPASRRAAH
jgi:uncharacterized damage-inducible protein DinB